MKELTTAKVESPKVVNQRIDGPVESMVYIPSHSDILNGKTNDIFRIFLSSKL